jgi:hypothetical protein
MEEQSVRPINGWIRLWIALAVIGLIPAIYTLVHGGSPPTPGSRNCGSSAEQR